MKCSRTRNRCIFNAVLVLITVVMMITPEWASNGSLTLKFFLLILWYIDSFLYAYGKRFRGAIFTIVLVLFFLFQLLYEFFGISTANFGNYVSMWFFFDIIIKALYIKQFYDGRLKRVLCRLFQVIMLVNILWNSYLGNTYEGIHMMIIEQSEKYVGMNVATTTFYNMAAFFIGFNVLLFFRDKKIATRIFDVGTIVMTYYFMLTCSPRLTSLFVSIFISILVIMCHVKKRRYRILLGTVLGIFTLLIAFCMTEEIINILPERIGVRIAALMALEGNVNQPYLARFDLVSVSLNTFTENVGNFLFGAGYHLGYKYIDLIGQHSLIPDYLAAYGCIGLLFMLYFFVGLKNMMIRNVNVWSDRAVMKVFVFGLFLISLMSKSFVPEIACGTILMPVLLDFCKEGK